MDALEGLERLRAARDRDREIANLAPEMVAALVAVARCGNGGAKLSRDAIDKVRAVIEKIQEAAK